MEIRIISDRQQSQKIAEKITHLMNEEGYILQSEGERDLYGRPNHARYYLNFIPETIHENLNDEL
ncbi:MAG: hypothetical protein VKJ46_15925 [Leptolyngbyaceae bacterium]|nr:hypothetical protein [Leptolyngbyaceae bacterium]